MRSEAVDIFTIAQRVIWEIEHISCCFRRRNKEDFCLIIYPLVIWLARIDYVMGRCMSSATQLSTPIETIVRISNDTIPTLRHSVNNGPFILLHSLEKGWLE